MNVPPIDLKNEYKRYGKRVSKRVEKVCASGMYVLGKEVAEFEERFARFTGAKHAVGVASCSDGLLLALMALGVGEGDEVIVPAFTFFSTASAAVRLGAKPVFVDIGPVDYGLKTDEVERKITARTKAVIPVHLYGNPCRIKDLRKITKPRGVHVVEDCAQAVGARVGKRHVGTFGDFGAFSFYPTKTMGAFGDAGIVATNSKKLAEKMKILRNHGESPRYHNKFLGVNSRLDEMQAAVLNVKLDFLSKDIEARKKIAKYYGRLFKEARLSEAVPPRERKGVTHAFHQYVIRAMNRDELLARLREKGIGANVYYPVPLHLQPCLDYLGYTEGDFLEAEEASRDTLALPIYATLKPAQQKFVVETIREFYRR